MYCVATDDDLAAERERTILAHLPQVRYVAKRIHDRVPDSVSLDDLISTGIIGLIAAVDSFDPRMNVQLKTYAEYKIRGAILDSLRGMDWAPRETRKRSKQIESAIDSARKRLQREPEEDEIARELNLSLQDYHGWLTEVQGIDLEHLEYGAPGRENVDLLQFVSDSKEKLPSQLLERSELEKLVVEAVGKMPRLERTIISLYYQEELSLREIAQVTGMHLSRVSQLKAQALLRLRAYMERLWPNGRKPVEEIHGCK